MDKKQQTTSRSTVSKTSNRILQTYKKIPVSNNQILNYAWELKKNGIAETTIKTATDELKRLSKLCDINDSEQVKITLSTLEWKNSTKHNACQIYTGFLKFLGKTWTPPIYKREHTLPFIPTEQE